MFDALSAEAVGLCQRAALEALPMTQTANARVGVFTTSPAVTPLQIYTDDPTLVRQAVRRVMATGQSHRPDGEALQALRDRREALERQSQNAVAQTSSAGGAGLAGTSSNIGQVEMERRLAIGQLRMLQSFDVLEREQRGTFTTSALFTILQSLVEMPGRKTLVLFSEGLPASPALEASLQAGRRGGQPRQHHRLCDRRERPARGERHCTTRGVEIEEAAKERLRQLSVADRLHRSADHAPDRAHRGPAEARLARRPGAARRTTPAASWSATPTTSAARCGASTKTPGSTTC